MKCSFFNKNILGIIGFYFLLSGCNSTQKVKLKYVDRYEIISSQYLEDKQIGGLSGIEYDAENGVFYVVTDDRSGGNESHYYNFHLLFEGISIDTVLLSSCIILKNDPQSIYKKEVVDFESIRYNPVENEIVIGNEGGNRGNPEIRFYHLNGDFKRKLSIDSTYLNALRPNKSFENLSFSKDYKFLYYAAETTLISDGEEASLNSGSCVRILKSKVKTGEIEQEYLYKLEKIPEPAEIAPLWNGTGSDNGLAEILGLDKYRFLMLERSGAYQKNGTFNYICRVFLARIPKNERKKQLCQLEKELIFDFSSLPCKAYNIEGMTLGPVLNGKQTLLFVSDNNFTKDPSVIYLFTIDNSN